MNYKKSLGIDYGDFTIGLAIFDLKMDFIYPYKTIWREKANVLRKSIREIIDIIDKEEIDDIVVGLPLNADGTSGIRVEKVNEFVKMLSTKIEAFCIKKNKETFNITLQDERLTTKEAAEILSERGVKKSEHKKVIDQVAAELILGDYRENIITLASDDGDINVEVIDQTVVDGISYLLVADVTDGDEDNDCYILKDVSNQNSEEANYEVVSDEEADKIFEVFTKILKDEIDMKK